MYILVSLLSIRLPSTASVSRSSSHHPRNLYQDVGRLRIASEEWLVRRLPPRRP